MFGCLFILLFDTPHKESVRACNLRKYAQYFVCYLSRFRAFLPEFSFLLSLLFYIVFFIIFISIFRRRVDFSSSCLDFFWIVLGLLGICDDLYIVPHISDTYERGPHFLFRLRCCSVHTCASVILCTPTCLFYRGIASTPELLAPVL